MPADRLVILGQFAGAHGVRGEFKLRSFAAAPEDIAAYGPLATADGRRLTLSLLRETKPGLFVARAKEIKTREECDAWSGALLGVPRTALPAPQEADEFYLEDLKGLSARTPDGAPAGTVKGVQDYGAGDVLELDAVPGRKGPVLLPFTKEDVPEIDLGAGYLTVLLPPEDEEDDAAGDEGEPSSER